MSTQTRLLHYRSQFFFHVTFDALACVTGFGQLSFMAPPTRSLVSLTSFSVLLCRFYFAPWCQLAYLGLDSIPPASRLGLHLLCCPSQSLPCLANFYFYHRLWSLLVFVIALDLICLTYLDLLRSPSLGFGLCDALVGWVQISWLFLPGFPAILPLSARGFLLWLGTVTSVCAASTGSNLGLLRVLWLWVAASSSLR